MNKTVNINLGGVFFHIDENAYQKLSHYFDAIKRSLTNATGQDEIIKDIEMRVAELLSEKQKSDKHVIGLKEVDEIIAVMGQPEDYIIEDENKTQNQYNFNANSKTKKLYRDSERGKIGGVAAGLSHYFGIDIVWIRVLLVLFVFFGFGTGILAYIIIWIVTPEAQTTSEKLEMTGEAVNISNIEKKVREEFENVSDKIKNADYNKYGNNLKKNANQVGNSLGNVILSIFKIIAKFLGVILIITGVTTLIFLLIGVFTIGTNTFIDFPWQGFVETGDFTDFPIWVLGLLMFLLVGIPFFFLTLLGFKLLAPNFKSIGNIAKYTLLALWIIAVAFAISIGIKQASAFANQSRALYKESFTIMPNDTLLLKFKYNELYAKNINDHKDFKIIQDSTNTNVIYSNQIDFEIRITDKDRPYIQIEKEAKGKSLFEAKQRAEKIKYNYKVIGNQLIFDNYLLSDLKHKYRDQEVKIIVFLQEGTLFKIDKTLENYDRTDGDYFLWNPNLNDAVYKVTSSKIICINCNNVENDKDDNNITTENTDDTITTIKTSKGKVITVDKRGIKKGLSINSDGIIIKSN